MGFGDTQEQAYSEYGVSLNNFDSYQSDLSGSTKLTFIYIMNSEKVQLGQVAARIHYDMVLPLLQEFKGFFNAMVFDCAHPSSEET